MTVEEKRRELFEPWLYQRPESTSKSVWDNVYDAGGFVRIHMFNAFNAALDAIEIELPSVSMSEYATRNDYNCATEAIGYARQSIESLNLGIKIK